MGRKQSKNEITIEEPMQSAKKNNNDNECDGHHISSSSSSTIIIVVGHNDDNNGFFAVIHFCCFINFNFPLPNIGSPLNRRSYFLCSTFLLLVSPYLTFAPTDIIRRYGPLRIYYFPFGFIMIIIILKANGGLARG